MKNDQPVLIKMPKALWSAVKRIAGKRVIPFTDGNKVSANEVVRDFIREGVSKYDEKREPKFGDDI